MLAENCPYIWSYKVHLRGVKTCKRENHVFSDGARRFISWDSLIDLIAQSLSYVRKETASCTKLVLASESQHPLQSDGNRIMLQ